MTVIKQKAYNERLQSIHIDSLFEEDNTIAVISHTSCIGCVEYLLKQGICKNFIYQIDNLSASEMNQVKFRTSDPNCHFYFIVSEFDNIIESNEKSPVLIYKTNDNFIVFNYEELNKLTYSFTAKGRKIKTALKKLY